MDALDAMSRAITYRDQLPDNDPGRSMTDKDMLGIIEANTHMNRPRHRPTITYADPTGDQAAARADRSRR
jgi:hypothetical protein